MMTSDYLKKRTTCLILLHVYVALAGPVRTSRTADLNVTGVSPSTSSLAGNRTPMEGGLIFGDANRPVAPQLLTVALRTNLTSDGVTFAPLDVPLFYPSSPSHRPAKHYGLPRETYHPLPTRRSEDSLRRPSALGPVRPTSLGFPPISSTRDNVRLEINWAAKVGRAHRSFYDFLLA